ncbi:MAG TPA: hypothetical protein PLS00_18585, partial [Niabella sp.]|nr:hypothetical protein [Niabella sp.]
MKQLIPFCILYLLVSCTAKKQNDTTKIEEPPVSGLSGKELAVTHCSRCHAFVRPELLTKTIWKEDVLPAMGFRMGIYNSGSRPDSLFDAGISGDMVRSAGIYPESPVLAKADWHKIEQYFMEHAPDTIPAPLRK